MLTVYWRRRGSSRYYAEETLLHAGLFDKPSRRLRETMWELMRLRALRVVVDAGLGAGTISEAAAVELLAGEVPMSEDEAASEVAMRLQDPGQGSILGLCGIVGI